METFLTKGVCSREINFEIKKDKIVGLNFIGGCDGNLKGLTQLCLNMNIDDVINKLAGIRCGRRSTSCPDQLSKALIEYKKGE
ncbi:TIGR03905 family TSCPD domain-containing protein [Clostridium sediminicola]|uniref:TIGR03905 family TSCPD domain-containing protein n=1 Tax=Clostridium sediminicola TaxID=3114879 RepID=UPI0031F211E2